MSSSAAQPARDPSPEDEPGAPDPTNSLSAQPTRTGPLDAGPLESASLEPRWAALQLSVRRHVQPGQFETWFRRAALVYADGEVVRIALQDNFSRGWLDTYYREALERAVIETFGSPRRLEFLVDPEAVARPTSPDRAQAGPPDPGTALPPPPGSPASAHERTPESPGGTDAATRQGLLLSSDLGLNPKYTFDNFVVGPCNRFAWAASAGTAEAPGKAYNPFFLHGSVGLGKTHLLQSLCFSLLERNPKTRILYLSCETFVNHFINALEDGDLQKFRHKYRNVDVLVVDDIHLLANKERTQEEFFHTFNALHQQGKQIVLSSDSPPRDIPTLQERLVSRFKWGLVTEIEPPCYETRMAILKRKSRDRGREIPDDVARLLAERVDSNIRELEGAVTKLLSYAGLSGRPVTPELAREALREIFASRKGLPSMEDILNVVTQHFEVKLSELQSKKRTNTIAFPRQVAMWIARQITRHSLEEIGGFFGGRDHSTVIYAVDKIARRADEDLELRSLLDGLLQKLKATPE